MKIWSLDFLLDDYESFWACEEISIAEQRTFDGRSKIDHWGIRQMKEGSSRKHMPLANATDFNAIFPVFDTKTLDILRDLIEDTVEILPMEFKGTIWHGINVKRVLDAIDYDKAEITRFSDGQIMMFDKYAFRSEIVRDVPIFKIVDEPVGHVFVSDEFKKRVEESNLTGFKFLPVWDSEV